MIHETQEFPRMLVGDVICISWSMCLFWTLGFFLGCVASQFFQTNLKLNMFFFMTRWFFQALFFYPYLGMMDPKITTSSISGWIFSTNQPSFSWWCASPPVLASNVNLSCRLLFHGCVRHLSFVHLPEFTELYMWRYYLLLSSCNAFAPRFLAKNKRGMIGGAALIWTGLVFFCWDHFLDKQI